MYRHILVCTDGSEVAQKGIDHGLDLAKAIDAKVTIITVMESLPAYIGSDGGLSAFAYQDYAAVQEKAAERILANAKQDADRVGVEAEILPLLNALPAEAIVETAKTHGCDLIVMSSHGRRGLRRLVLGSVTSEVLTSSPVPVLVAR